MDMIMSGQATDAQIGAYLIALRMKGEAVDEIAGSAEAMRAKALTIEAPGPMVVDTCGTGGDARNTFNISTTAAFVVAACGVTVAKHGNRSISSKSGSADVLKALGVNIDADASTVQVCLRKAGIGFLFAPRHHGAMRHALGPRKELGIRTIFNLLGPLTNPAGAPYQVVGVYDRVWTRPLARVLRQLGASRAMVVHGEDGLDEITNTAVTQVAELKEDQVVESYPLSPEQFGMPRASLDDLRGGDAATNAAITREILAGVEGPRRDVILLNAGAALYVCGAASDLQVGVDMAAQAIDNGEAARRLALLVEHSNADAGPA